ncbi:MAG: hypothetical protein ACYC0V_04920 [Armatimonadota bacterium]
MKALHERFKSIIQKYMPISRRRRVLAACIIIIVCLAAIFIITRPAITGYAKQSAIESKMLYNPLASVSSDAHHVEGTMPPGVVPRGQGVYDHQMPVPPSPNRRPVPRTDRHQGIPPVRPPDKVRPSCMDLVLIAADLRRSKRDTSSLTEKEISRLPEGWEEGLPIAIRFLDKRMSEVVPFTAWVMKIKMDPMENHFSRRMNIEELNSAYLGIERTVGRSFAGAFRLTAILTAPKDTNMNEIQSLPLSLTHINDTDLKALFKILSKRRLNNTIAVMVSAQGQEAPWLQEWMKNLLEAQDDCAYGISLALSRSISTGDAAQIRKQLKRLSRADDWGFVMDASTYMSQTLVNRGMRNEAIQLLQIYARRGIGGTKTSAQVELSKLTGNPPKQPAGSGAGSSSKWLYTARANRDLGRMQDARSAGLKAVRGARNPRQRVDALRFMAEVDPNGAPDLIVRYLPEFLRRIDHNDGEYQSSISDAGHALFAAAEIQRSLAPRVIPLIKRISDSGQNERHQLAKDLALVNLWAGNYDEGVRNLSDGFGDCLLVFFGVLVRDGLSDAARAKVLQGLKAHLASTNPTPKAVEQAISSTMEIRLDTEKRMKTGMWLSVYGDALSPDGMKALAATLWRYLSTSPDSTPEALKLRALAGLPFPESLAKVGKRPEGDIKPYKGASRRGNPVRGSDPSGTYTTRTYTVAANAQKVVDYYRKPRNMSSNITSLPDTGIVADFSSSPMAYQVLIHIQAKGASQTEFTITVYGT